MSTAETVASASNAGSGPSETTVLEQRIENAMAMAELKSPTYVNVFQKPEGVCRVCFARLKGIQPFLGGSFTSEIKVSGHEVTTHFLETDADEAVKVLAHFNGLNKPEVRQNRMLVAKDLYEDPMTTLTEAEIIASFIACEEKKAAKAIIKGKVKVEVATKEQFTVKVPILQSCTSGDKEKVRRVIADNFVCGCASKSCELILDKKAVYSARGIDTSRDIVKGVISHIPTYATGKTVKPNLIRFVHEGSIPLKYQQRAAQVAGVAPKNHILAGFLPYIVITWLYSLFGPAAERPSINGRKRISNAWKHFYSGEEITNEVLFKFRTFCVSNPWRELPAKLTDLPQLKKEWGGIENDALPSWLKIQYQRDYDLPDFLAKVSEKKITALNVHERNVDETFLFRSFLGMNEGKVAAEKATFTEWVMEKANECFVKVGNSFNKLNSKQINPIKRLLSELEANGKKSLVNKLFQYGKESKTKFALNLCKDKGTIGEIIQNANGFNNLIGLESIHVKNYSSFPSLKKPIRKYLKAANTEAPWEIRVNALNTELTKTQLDEIMKVSGKGKGDANKRGNKGEPKKNTPKVQQNSSLPGVSDKPDDKKPQANRAPPGACRDFWFTNNCRFGVRCKYQHVPNGGSRSQPTPQPPQQPIPQQQPPAYQNGYPPYGMFGNNGYGYPPYQPANQIPYGIFTGPNGAPMRLVPAY